MNKFRLASRSTFNQFFHPSSYGEEGIAFQGFEYFEDVEQALFTGLVLMPCQLNLKRYGEDVMDEIGVRISSSEQVPVMINREEGVGLHHRPVNYWDNPVKKISSETKMSFVEFFDFDHARAMDHRYGVICHK